jgi:hypothetical protein
MRSCLIGLLHPPILREEPANGETGLAPHLPLQLLHLRLDYQVNRFMGCDCHIEGAFQDLTVILQCEPNTLGYPPAALFAFCLAVVAYNVLRLTRAALGAAHGQEKIERAISSYSLAQELAKVFTGRAIALPAEEWPPYVRMPPLELAGQLRQWAQQAPLWRDQKHPRGPKKPRPRRGSGAKISQVATTRLLANMK